VIFGDASVDGDRASLLPHQHSSYQESVKRFGAEANHPYPITQSHPPAENDFGAVATEHTQPPYFLNCSYTAPRVADETVDKSDGYCL